MIVQIKENNSDKYNALFKEAYEFLASIDDGLVTPGQERFQSLAEYYGHIADLFNAESPDKYKYIMLPLDEEPFEIDLNTRTINVPKSFNKCASVQSDKLAETIIFIVDRYFDYMDLANTDIYIQWETPDKQQGATRVEMRDLDTEKNKIRFAWPLSSTITNVPGDLKFAVRFFRIDNNLNNVYSLNTLDAKITIKQSPFAEVGNLDPESPIGDNLFAQAIINSNFTHAGVPEPIQPSYGMPGNNIMALNSEDELVELSCEGNTRYACLDSNNTLTLCAQAYTPDAGNIQYTWSRQVEDNAAQNVIDGDDFTFGNKFILVNEDAERVPHEKYYRETTEEDGILGIDGKKYCEYVGEFGEDAPSLYERYTVLMIKNTETDITGNYWVAAKNIVNVTDYIRVSNLTAGTFGDGEYYYRNVDGAYLLATTFEDSKQYYMQSSKELQSVDVQSYKCVLPAPTEIVIATDLPEGAILENEQVNLSIALESPKYEQTNISYAWQSKNTVDGDFTNIEGATAASYEANAEGWYKVHVVAELNRKETEKDSAIIKVTNLPDPPKVVSQETGSYNVSRNAATLVVAVDSNTVDENNPLKSDAITYIWQIQVPDAEWVTIVNEPGVQITGTGNTLVVNNTLKYAAAKFRCLVINELNGHKAIFNHSEDAIADKDIAALGTYMDEPPYTYGNVDEDGIVVGRETNSFEFIVTNY